MQLIYLIKSNNIELTEKIFHKIFKEKNIGGEWFNLDEKDIEYIKSGKYPQEIMNSINGI